MNHREAYFNTIGRFGIKASDVAKHSGLSKSYISQYKSGKDIGVNNFFKLLSPLPKEAKAYYLFLVMDDDDGKLSAA